MLRFILLSALVAVAHCGGGASPRGGGKGSPLFAFGGQAKGAGGGLGGLGSLGGGGGLGGLGGFGGGSLVSGGGAPQTIQAAVHSTRTITFNDVPYSASSAGPLNIEVGGSGGAINFLFKSSSSPINVDIEHSGGGGSYKETSSTEKPHHRIHTIIRPVIQELREIIQPTRLIKQTIEPVNEAVETIASKSQGGQAAAPAAPAVVPGGGYGSGAAGSGAAPGGGGYGSGAVQAPSAGGDYTQQQTTGWAAARA